MNQSWIEVAERAEQATRRWLDKFVIDLNLCPFAKKEVVRNRVRFVVSDAESEEELLTTLMGELRHLEALPETETTLLIHPRVLTDFNQYNEFLDVADGLLVELEMDGEFQIASFHPDYRFSGTEADDPENHTNRSPFPMLHLLREASVERAVDAYPNAESIPERNIELMNRMGREQLVALLEACLKDSPESSPPASESP